MFREACEVARGFTSPYVGLRRKHDGTVFSTMAAFMVVNADGWALTARHVFDEIMRAQQSIAEVQKVDQQLAVLRGQKGDNAKQRNRQIRKLEKDRGSFLSNHAEIWAAGDDWQNRKPRVTEARLPNAGDIALFKIDGFVPSPEHRYPVFRREPLDAGVSVCRIGFPWHSVEADFKDGNFDVKGGFPAPLFVQEGVISRFLVEEHPNGARVTYIQTSTPGLRGQSGGPLFDHRGRLCGLQSSTTHLDLGFDATYERDGKKVIERQFLNVGQAVHVDDICAFLDANDIHYETEERGDD